LPNEARSKAKKKIDNVETFFPLIKTIQSFGPKWRTADAVEKELVRMNPNLYRRTNTRDWHGYYNLAIQRGIIAAIDLGRRLGAGTSVA
jgi:hypothetical protein